MWRRWSTFDFRVVICTFNCGYILWRVCELAAGMIKFKLFGPKVCCFGPRRAFGAAYGGRGWETTAPQYGIKRRPPNDLASVAVWEGGGWRCSDSLLPVLSSIADPTHIKTILLQFCEEKRARTDRVSASDLHISRSAGKFERDPMIRQFCITILYHNLLLFIDIFHI
jgi:hypothetical protein